MSELLSSAPPDAPWTAGDATFGARLALIRQRMGWNAKEAALACGIPPQSWRTWESGVMPHGSRYFVVCAQIARAAGCDYGWLVDRRPSGFSKSPLPKALRNFTLVDYDGPISPPPGGSQMALLGSVPTDPDSRLP